MSFFTEPFNVLWKHRRMLFQTATNDLRARHAGSLLGLGWLFVYPLIFLGTYSIVYVYIFRIRFQMYSSNEYVAMIFCGLIPYLGFSEALSAGTGSIISNANLIKNTLFPIELVPVKTVLTAQATQMAGLVLLVMVLGFLGRLSPWIFCLPLIWCLQTLFTIGVVWLFASTTVFVRDLQTAVAILILILMMLSPIAYTVDMIPERFRGFMALNPLYYIIVCYQDLLFLGKFPRPEVFWPFLLISMVSFLGGFWYMSRLKKAFADNV